MTGFGKVSKEFDDKTISVEIKSLNSKQLDLNLRLPYFLREKEMDLRAEVQRMLERGKVDMNVSVEYRQELPAASINPAMVKAYASQLSKIAEELNQSVNDMLGLILKMPDVLKNEKKELDEKEWKEILEVCILSADKLNQFRSREGETLSLEFTKRIQIIQALLVQVEKLDAGRIEIIRDRISKNIMDVVSSDKMDSNRMEQELIFYVEKMDITEEKVRLQTHLSYFLEAMKEPSCGRKLNFISQEIGREINTIGSKANDAPIQKLVVQMKDELEKIKEQSMNIL